MAEEKLLTSEQEKAFENLSKEKNDKLACALEGENNPNLNLADAAKEAFLKLTPEQREDFKNLTDEEKEQFAAIVSSNGEIDDEALASIAGGKLSPKLKKILGWSTAALAASAVAVMAFISCKKSGDSNKTDQSILTDPDVKELFNS